LSYPRSGNTLLRKYLENITGIVTGGDTIYAKLDKELVDSGLVGEGIFDERTWIVKSHYPERFTPQRYFNDRIVLIVRNPLDSIISHFHMVCTESHTNSVSK
jgi:hypothetical protein